MILAGGRGERLHAGMPKARVEVAGRTLLDRAVAILAPFCDDVAVVAPADVDAGTTSATRVRDVAGFEGPLAGLVAGLAWAGSEPGAPALVLGVDFPCVGRDLPRMLIERYAASRHAASPPHAIVPAPEGIPQPLVAIYDAAAAGELRAALDSGVRSLRGGLARLRIEWLDDAAIAALAGGAACLLNVNTPADLALASERLATESLS